MIARRHRPALFTISLFIPAVVLSMWAAFPGDVPAQEVVPAPDLVPAPEVVLAQDVPRAPEIVPPQDTPSEQRIRAVGPDQYVLAPFAIEHYIKLGSYHAMTAGTRIIPAFRDRQAIGFKIFGVRPNSIYAEVGLESGDIVQSINEIDVTSPDKALRAYALLRNARIFAVRIIRREEPRMLRYYVED
jgi:membrane-associated protease RseP (regulator of RpoE activity)